ncbi:MAG TPA: nickel pincer cofactor biosynthesis protein LarB [Holophagaceae bacterium]|nr:nickel pincer cofactor biosynthesis protein LarB [Holophagaceae bacterium]
MNAEVRWDHSREGRTGIPEVIFGPGKTVAQVVTLFQEAEGFRFATRLNEAQMAALEGVATVDPVSRTAVKEPRPLRHQPPVAVITAGTGDIPWATEAKAVLEALGHPAKAFFDVGVAGLHRMQAILPELRECPVVIVCAGMEGALPSVLAGLIDAPLIAVPTPIGAGISEGGTVALHGMLASCSPGIAVVNIGNGFGAACMAIKFMNRMGLLNTQR